MSARPRTLCLPVLVLAYATGCGGPSTPQVTPPDEGGSQSFPAAQAPAPGGVAPGPTGLVPTDLTPAGYCLTMNAPPQSEVSQAVRGVMVVQGTGFQVKIAPFLEAQKEILDNIKKQPDVEIVANEVNVLIAGTRRLGVEDFLWYVKVEAGGKTYLCSGRHDSDEPGFTKAQAVLMAECAKSLTQTADNKQAEVRMQKALARFDELDECGYDPTTHAMRVGGDDVTDADLGLLKDVPQIRYVSVSAEKVTPAGLEHLQALPNLAWVQFQGEEAKDAWLAPLSRLKLAKLTLEETAVTPSGLKQLKKLATVTSLTIREQTVAGASLKDVLEMPALTELELQKTETTDDALKSLVIAPNLKSLTLNENPITDAGLEHLARLKQLDSITLTGTKVTKEGVAKLKRALPRCDISSNAE